MCQVGVLHYLIKKEVKKEENKKMIKKTKIFGKHKKQVTMDRNRTRHQHQHQRQPQPFWFQGCPLSKFITFSTILTHLILENGGFSGGTDLLTFNIEDVMDHGEVYRLVLSPITFRSMGELVTGLMVLVPLMNQFEREFGTKKFGSFLLVKCMILSTMFQLASLVLLDGFLLSRNNGVYESTYYAPGPYPYIGALLYLYHVFTPRLYTKFIGILGFDFSEKVMTYLFSFVVIYSQGYSSILPSLCGFVASWISISQSNIYGQWDCKLPDFVNNTAVNVGKIFGLDSLVTTTTFLSRSGNMNAGNRGFRQERPNAPRRQQAPAPPQQPQFQPMPQPQPPSPEAIEQLTAMGFERDAVVRALGATDNNVEAAANRLLSGI